MGESDEEPFYNKKSVILTKEEEHLLGRQDRKMKLKAR